MSGFAALKTFEDSLNTATPVVENPAVDFLRKAINAPSLEETRKLIKEGIIAMNMLNKVELTTPTEVRMLDDEPRHFLFPELLS